jgi:hypothetical protein
MLAVAAGFEPMLWKDRADCLVRAHVGELQAGMAVVGQVGWASAGRGGFAGAGSLGFPFARTRAAYVQTFSTLRSPATLSLSKLPLRLSPGFASVASGPGPFARVILADIGAEVIRLDQPDSAPGIRVGLHRGRRSVAIDLKDASAIDVVRRIADRCDVLVEGGVAERARPRARRSYRSNGFDPEAIVSLRGLLRSLAAQGPHRLCLQPFHGRNGRDRDHVVLIRPGRLLTDCPAAELPPCWARDPDPAR